MNIRKAESSDIETLLDLGEDMVKESTNFQVPYNRALAKIFGLSAINGHEEAMFVAEKEGKTVGMIGVFVTPLWFSSPDLVQMQDFVFYVSPEARSEGVGGKLIEAAENWAKENGAVLSVLGSSAAQFQQDQGPLYRDAGYSEIGIIYRKGLR
jgi:GNAT superfamily N-acetyltransferase